ncbi:MAG: cyclic nucleotide-binding domain-containing protein [Betaproteobacteria bacterium]|nr:cyclic nucleotide-binding domain-containing protein [Betaproteobacteria bacterium]
MSSSPTSFSVDLAKVEAMGSMLPYSSDAIAAYLRLGLSSEDRLYHQLVSELSLGSTVFKPGSSLCIAGEPAHDAYVVRHGELAIQVAGQRHQVGPGAVIGLAAGFADVPHNMTATAVTVVTVSVIPIFKAIKAFSACHPGLRGINRSTVMRILKLASVP